MSRAAHRPIATSCESGAADAVSPARPERRARRVGAAAISTCLIGLLGGGGLVHAQDETSTTTATSVPGDSVPTGSVPTGSVPTGSVPTGSVPTDPTAPDGSVVPAAVPGSFNLPLFGVPLTVEVTTGPGGVISGVELTPADGTTATTNRPNKVAFVNEAGTARVVVRTNGGGQRVEARAGSLEAFVGQPGGWSGEIFPGVPASVSFTVTADGGVPDIVVGEVTGPSHVVGAVERSTDDDADDGEQEQEVSVRIQFVQDGMRRSLSIKVEVETDDGETRAKLRISLSRPKSEPFAAATVGAEQVWTGVLCDGTPASVAYTVTDGGTIALGAVSPEPARTKAEGNSVEVRFGGGERLRLTVRGGSEGPSVKLDDTIRCKNAPDPTLNVPVRDDDDSDDDRDDRQDGKPRDDKPRDDKSRDDKSRDDKSRDDKSRDGKGGDRGKDRPGSDGTIPATSAPATTAPAATAPVPAAPDTTASAPTVTSDDSDDGDDGDDSSDDD